MYYPDQRIISPYTVIRHDVTLPDEASGAVRVNDGKRVDIRDMVVNGVIPTGYIIVEAAAQLRLRKGDDLPDLMQVNLRDVVDEDQVIAKRGRREVTAPIRGIVEQVKDGRIILQKVPQIIDIEAGVRGRVIEIMDGRGVVIEAVGARVQGMWGNGKQTISPLRPGPEGDLSNLAAESLETRYAGSVVLTRRPLTRKGLQTASVQALAGIIAPSMEADLRRLALAHDSAIILTEGFGSARMNNTAYSLLAELEGQQVNLDASTPDRWETRYPEIIVNVPSGDRRPSKANTRLVLRPNATVRLTREPHLGATGKVIDLPKSPVLLDNGLRVMCAQVQLVAGDTLHVPLANLEVLGR